MPTAISSWRLKTDRLGPWLRRHPLLDRIVVGFTIRPWLIDIGCGMCSVWWGFWVLLHHGEVAMSRGFVMFRPIIGELSSFVLILGVLQVIIAIMKNRTRRTLIAMVSVVLWSGLAIGVQSAAGQGAYTGHALLNALIILRAY